MPATILVRYGELALKSPPVRREFEHRLERNILDLFLAEGVACRLRSDHGHLYVSAEGAGTPVRLLRRAFGVTSVSEVTEVPTDIPRITESLLALAEPRLRPHTRFAVRARRVGTHPFTSQKLAAELGAAVLKQWPERELVVDLEEPEVELSVEVRGPRTYLSLGRENGPGGLPLGVAGRVVAAVDGPRGALGAFLMMKRGCRCSAVVTPAGRPLAERVLRRFDPRLAIVEAEGTEEARRAALHREVEAAHADGVVLPLGVEEFPQARIEWGDVVVFSPTVGLSDAEVSERWTKAEELAS